jgi:hypothetical protein
MRSSSPVSVQPSKYLGYEEIRSTIKNGDVLLYRGRSLPSRVIQWITHSRYSHAGLAAWWNGRLMVMEAVGKGVVVTPLSANVRSYHGEVEWFTCVEDIPDADRQRMIEFAQQELGKEYARWKAIRLGLRILFQKDRKQRDKLRRERQLFCSHYVAQAYNAVGKDLKKGVSDRFMSPADVAGSPLLKRAGLLWKTVAGPAGVHRAQGK